jgi:HEAT repeat protein
VALTGVLAAAIIALRVRLRAREREWQDFVHRWRPALLAAILDPGAQAVLPPLRPAEHVPFLRLWAYLHESLRGDAANRLNDTARALGLDATVRHLLRAGSRAEQLQSVLAAGLLRDRASWEALVEIANTADSLLSVNAARSLVRIDPMTAAHTLVPLLARRDDWDLSRVAAFLDEARQPFWLVMAKTIPELTGEPLARALLLAEALRLQLPDATLARLLQHGQAPSVVRAALALAESPGLAQPVRACLAHADPLVRSAAAVRMARFAGPQDERVLQRLLQDPEWSVRQAAAQTLCALPTLDATALELLLQANPLASDVMRQALAERVAV